MSARLTLARMRVLLAFFGMSVLAGLPMITESIGGPFKTDRAGADVRDGRFGQVDHGSGGDAGGAPATVRVAAETGANAAGAGGVPVEFEISADNFETPGGKTLQGLQPLLIRAMLVGTNAHYTLRNLDMRIGGIEVAGEITVDSSAAKPTVTGTLTSRSIDLTALLPAAAAEPARPRDQLFPTAQLPLQVPSSFNARIDLHASEIKLPALELRDVEAKVTLANGALTVDSLRAQLAGGTIEGSLAIFGATDPPVVELRAKAIGITPERISQVAASGVVRGAPTDLTLDLRGRGRSVADILGSSNGNIVVGVGPGEFGDAATGISILDTVFGLVRVINPLAVKQERTQLQCAVLNFHVQDGVAANPTGVAVQTDSLNILGGGTVDLGSERIDLAGKPKRRKTGMLALMGVEAEVSVGGTLRKPEVTTGASVGAGTVGRVGAAWMTGGLTLIASGIFDKISFGDDVCEVARAPAPRQ